MCYVMDHCRCEHCKAAHRSYDLVAKRWRGEYPREPRPLVDPGPAREHVADLMAAGMGYLRIAEVSGVSASSVAELMWGRRDRPTTTIRRQTAEKLLACRFDLADGARVPAREARVIVDELVSQGWTQAAIAERVHGPQSKKLDLRGDRVFAGTLVTLRHLLFEQPPLRRSRTGQTYRQAPTRPARVVRFDTPGVRLPVVDGVEFDRFDPDARRSAPARRLVCRFCGRPLADHGIMERCTMREPIGDTA